MTNACGGAARQVAATPALRWLAAAATLAWAALTLTLGGPAPAAHADPGGQPSSASLVAPPRPQPSVKYYVVQPVHGGQQEFLFEIAQRTLGNGNRFPEIVALNRGRPQPDGGRLADANVINAGWVLQLPPDAHGAGVQFGPLPTAA